MGVAVRRLLGAALRLRLGADARRKRKAAEVAAAVRKLVESASVLVDRPAVEAGLAVLERGGDFADGVIAFEGQLVGGSLVDSGPRTRPAPTRATRSASPRARARNRSRPASLPPPRFGVRRYATLAAFLAPRDTVVMAVPAAALVFLLALGALGARRAARRWRDRRRESAFGVRWPWR